MKVGIIGLGLIGQKRWKAIEATGDHVAWAYDPNKTGFDRKPTSDDFFGIDAAIVATPNNAVLEWAEVLTEKKIPLLIEKPLGRNLAESVRIEGLARRAGTVLHVGFNHRFFPGILRARSMVREGAIGKVVMVRGRYGHGGRPGMEKEWRASRELCGGGELLDQGVHLIDLFRFFTAEDVTKVMGHCFTSAWPIEVEDNSFFWLESKAGVRAQFHASWTNWKNIFSFEIFGSGGFLNVNGLTGSYGNQVLEWGVRAPMGGPPRVERFEFPENAEETWSSEWKEFRENVIRGRQPEVAARCSDGLMANKIVQGLYQSNQEGRWIEL